MPLVVILIGCPSVDFETETVVHDDGALTRTVRYVASDEGRDELEERYALFDGGEWSQTAEKRKPHRLSRI